MSRQGAEPGLLNAAESLLGPARSMAGLNAPALIAGPRTVSYPELDAAACRAGHALRVLGADVGERVLLIGDDRPEFFFAYLGALKIGAVPVALNLRLTAADLAYIVDDSAAKLLLADRDFLALGRAALAVSEAAPRLVVLDGSDDAARPIDDLPGLMEGQSDTLEPVMLVPDAMALWMYTSGTTGRPKAVMHRQRTLPSLDRYLGPIYGVGPGDRVFCSSKLFFAFSLGHILFAGLRLGATMILNAGWPSAEAVARVIEDHRPTVVLSVPTLYRLLLAEGRAGTPAFQAVRHYLSAGEKLPEPLFERWRAATGTPILEGLGATEVLIMVIGTRPDDARPGVTGVPHPETEVKLVGEDGAEITEAGVPGVLWVRCPSVALGYWNRPERTAAAFRDGWYVTGDVLFCDPDGHYVYQGRADDMLKVSGQWVSPAEIEDHVLTDPRVAEAAVIGVETADGFVRLALCLVPAGHAVDHEDLKDDICAALSEKLSIYKCPRRFVFLDDMPKTATGKLQRFRLRQIAADFLSKTDAGAEDGTE